MSPAKSRRILISQSDSNPLGGEKDPGYLFFTMLSHVSAPRMMPGAYYNYDNIGNISCGFPQGGEMTGFLIPLALCWMLQT